VPAEKDWASVERAPRPIEVEAGRYAWQLHPSSQDGSGWTGPEPVSERQMADRARDHIYT